MNIMEKSINKPDWIMLISIIIQVTLGISFIYSVSGSHSEQITGNYYSFFHSYLLALLFSFIAASLMFSYYSSSAIKKYSNWILVIIFLLLSIILIPGAGSMRGAKLGLSIGPVFIYILPVITLLLIVSASRYIADHYEKNTFRSTHTWKIALTFLTICILILNQPNGKGIVILGILLIIISFSAKLYKLCGFFALTLLLVFMGVMITNPYRVEQFLSFIDPFENFFDSGYPLAMSLSTIGGGNLLGVGYGEGLVNQNLPDAFDGFIFASIIEETGFLGAFVIILCSVIIQWRSFSIARSLICSNRHFEGLLVIGVSSWISLLCILHMSVCLGLFSTHYVPYPFLSFDHSYLMALLVGCAIIVRIGMTVAPIKCLDNIKLQPASTILLLLFFLIGFKTLFSAALDRDLTKHYLEKADIVKKQLQKRHRTKKNVPASELRGRITERYGKVLARNRLMFDIWINPIQWNKSNPQWKNLTALLSVDETITHSKIAKLKLQNKKFAYLKRKVDPDIARQVKKLALEGIYLSRKSYRYYPYGELASQVIGITNIDGIGQDGIERQFEETLKTNNNSKKNRNAPDLQLSIDLRIQEIATQALQDVVHKNRAKSGTVVLLNAQTGEVLAMVSIPSFNSNKGSHSNLRHRRNRVIQDVFEPGETMLPFTLLAALESKHYTQHSLIDTDPGFINIGSHTIQDEVQLGKVNLKTILHKTSKVGVSKIFLHLPKNSLPDLFKKVGFFQHTTIELPDENTGGFLQSDSTVRASLSYGYGLQVTSLQLAQAYMLIANDGKTIPVTLIKRLTVPESKQIVSPFVVSQLREILMADSKHLLNGKESVVQKYSAKGYSKDRLRYIYAGMSSVTTQPLVIVVTIDQPEPTKESKNTSNNISENLAADIIEKSLKLLGTHRYDEK